MNKEEIIKELNNMIRDKDSKFWIGLNGVNAVKEVLNYIDKLQKDNYKLDRENQHFFDRIQDLQKENKELKEDNKKLCAEISDLKELLGE